METMKDLTPAGPTFDLEAGAVTFRFPDGETYRIRLREDALDAENETLALAFAQLVVLHGVHERLGQLASAVSELAGALAARATTGPTDPRAAVEASVGGVIDALHQAGVQLPDELRGVMKSSAAAAAGVRVEKPE